MCGCRASICFVGILVSAALLILNCADRRPLQHRPVDPLLFISVATPDGIALDVIDTGCDSVEQRIYAAGSFGSAFLQATCDGAHLVTFDLVTRISVLDVSTFELVASVPTKCRGVCVTGSHPRVVGWTPDSLYFYSIPTLTLDTILPLGADYCIASCDNEQIVVLRPMLDSVSSTYVHGLLIISADSYEPIAAFPLVSPIASTGIAPLFPSRWYGRGLLHLVGIDSLGPALFSFDIEARTCRFRRAVESPFGAIAVSPDGREVWLSQSYPSRIIPPPSGLGYILICDANTGHPLDTIRTVGLRVGQPSWPLPIGAIAFHTTLPKAYVLSHTSQPALLILDISSHIVTGVRYASEYTNVFDIALADQ